LIVQETKNRKSYYFLVVTPDLCIFYALSILTELNSRVRKSYSYAVIYSLKIKMSYAL